jgi:hypothetical protein
MIRSGFGVLALTVGLLVVAPIGSASAEAPFVSGSDLALAPNDDSCLLPGPISCTFGLSALPADRHASGGVRAGMTGVIVKWSMRTATNLADITTRLRVIHGVTGAGSGPLETLPAVAGTYTYLARVAVKEGDEIGVDFLNLTVGSPHVIRESALGAQFDGWIPPLGEGEERGQTAIGQARELEINATIEPDADHDGFGDWTQDQCPKNAEATVPPCEINCAFAANGGCGRSPGIPVAPRARITKGPKGTVHTDHVKFSFKSRPAGASFECKLDGRPMKPCRSPKAYRNLGSGKHTFKVRAIAASGVRRSPDTAKRTFRVEP